jgi:hypothetical protein
VCTVVKAAGANPALFTIARRNPGATLKAFFAATRRAKLKALRGILGGGWS